MGSTEAFSMLVLEPLGSAVCVPSVPCRWLQPVPSACLLESQPSSQRMQDIRGTQGRTDVQGQGWQG